MQERRRPGSMMQRRHRGGHDPISAVGEEHVLSSGWMPACLVAAAPFQRIARFNHGCTRSEQQAGYTSGLVMRLVSA